MTETFPNQADVVFRIRKHYRNIGIVGIIVCLLAGPGSAYGVWHDAKGDPFYGIIFVSLVWSFFFGLSAWLLLTWWRANLTIRGGGPILQGVIRRKQCDLENVTVARWDIASRITLWTPQEKLRIDLRDFEPENRLSLIRFFRRGLSDSIQQGWDLFCYKIALPLQEDDSQGSQPPKPEQVVLTRRRWDWYFVPFIVLCAVIGVVSEPQLLAAPAMPAALWLFLRFSTPKQGLVSERLSYNPVLVFVAWWSVVAIVGVAILKVMESRMSKNQVGVATLGFIVLWAGGLLWRGSALERKARRRDQEVAKVAIERWSEGKNDQ